MVAEESQGRAVPEAPQACEAHNRADRRIETKTQSRTRMHALESESARLGPGTQHTEVIEMAEKHSCSVTTNDAHDSSTRSERGTRGVANPPAGEPQANGKDTPNRVALEGTAPSRWQSCLERFAKLRANVAKHVLHIGASAMALAAVAAAPSAMALPPVFSDTTLTREIAENTAADTNIGEPIPAATDGDGQTLSYTMGGTDADTFTFEDTTRQIKTKDPLDFESKSSYSVTITAEDTDNETGTVDVTITVTDVADDPTVSIGEGSAEEGEDVTFEVTFSEPATKAATVSWTASTAAGTASSNDLSGTTSGTLMFAIGETSGTVTISTVDDEVYEADETFTVSLTSATGAVLGTAKDASGTINNDETIPTLTLPLVSNTIRESNSGGNNHRTTMTPTLNGTVEGLIRVRITTETGELKHDIFTPTNAVKTYSITSGQPTGATIIVEANDNDIDEPPSLPT